MSFFKSGKDRLIIIGLAIAGFCIFASLNIDKTNFSNQDHHSDSNFTVNTKEIRNTSFRNKQKNTARERQRRKQALFLKKQNARKNLSRFRPSLPSPPPAPAPVETLNNGSNETKNTKKNEKDKKNDAKTKKIADKEKTEEESSEQENKAKSLQASNLGQIDESSIDTETLKNEPKSRDQATEMKHVTAIEFHNSFQQIQDSTNSINGDESDGDGGSQEDRSGTLNQDRVRAFRDPIVQNNMREFRLLLTDNNFDALNSFLAQNEQIDREEAFQLLSEKAADGEEFFEASLQILQTHFSGLESVQVLTDTLASSEANITQKQISFQFLSQLVDSWPLENSLEEFEDIFLEGVQASLPGPTQDPLSESDELVLDLSNRIFTKFNSLGGSVDISSI